MGESPEKPVCRDSDPDQYIESMLLASANAIQGIIAERDTLRNRVDILERELTLLRQQASLIHDGYRRLTNEFVTQFGLIDNAASNLFGEPEMYDAGAAQESKPGFPPSAA